MTRGVGTPLFAAPELMRGEFYDEGVDSYSFGMLLLSMAVEGNMLDFIAWRYGELTGKQNHDITLVVSIGMWREGWRPVSSNLKSGLPFAPPSIVALLVRCCSHDPKDRPSFSEIIEVLVGKCSLETSQASGATFKRWNFEAEMQPEVPAESDTESDTASNWTHPSADDMGAGQLPMVAASRSRDLSQPLLRENADYA